LDSIWEQVSHLGANATGHPHRIKVHKPRLEDRSGDNLQRLAHPAAEIDPVIESAEDVGDGALLIYGRKNNG
jgi:hypothetical protein